MTKERLEEIKDSIDLQLEVQRSLGYKRRYDDLLTEEIDLYNEVIDLQERQGKAIDYLYCIGEVIDPKHQQELLRILRGEEK